MKKLLYGILGIFLSLLLLILIVPNFIDWSHYKGPIGTAVKTNTGFELDLRGPIHLSLFPTPHLSAKDVYVKNKPGGEGKEENLIALQSVSLNADLLPLLSGKFFISQVELIEPVIYLETFKNGKNNWDIEKPLPVPASGGAAQNTVNPLVVEPEKESSKENFGFSLKKIKIKDGQVTYKNSQKNAQYEARDINLEGSMDSLTGPFAIKGQLDLNGYILKGDIHTGEVSGEKPSPLDGTLSVAKGKESYGTLQIKGTVQNKKFVGDIKSDALKIPFALDLKNKKLDFQKGIQLLAHVEAGPDNVKISNLALQVETMKVMGQATYKAPQIDFNLTLSDGSLALDFSGKGQSKDKVLWDGTIILHSDNIQTFLGWFNVEVPPYLQGALTVSTYLNATSKTYTLNSLKFNMGKLNGSGNAIIKLDQSRPYIKADVSLNRLDLNALMTSSHHTHTPSAVAPQTEASLSHAKVPTPANSNTSSSTRWSKDNWNLESLKVIDMDFNFAISEVDYDVYQLHQISGVLHLKDGNLQLTSFQAAGYGGHLSGGLNVHPGHPSSLKVNGTVQGVNLTSLPQLKQSPLKKATLGTSLHLSATGNNTWEVINSLSGNMHVALNNGVIEIFDVRKFIADIKAVRTPVDIYTVIQNLDKKADTRFEHLKADFTLHGGNAQTSNMEFVSDEIKVNAQGNINLPQWAINMNAQIKIKELGKLPSLGMKIEGSLDAPSYGMDEESLANVLLTGVAGQLLGNVVKNIGGGVGDVLNTVLDTVSGGKSPSGPTAAQKPKEEPSIKPEKILKNLLGL